MELRLFTTMTPQQYAGAQRFFAGQKAAEIASKWRDYLANAVGRAIINGDPQHLNKMLAGASNFGKYRETRRIVSFLEKVWKYDTVVKGFVGKANTDRLRNLRGTAKDAEAPRWEITLEQRITKEENAERQAQSAEFDFDKWVDNIVRRAEKENVDASLLMDTLRNKLTQAAA